MPVPVLSVAQMRQWEEASWAAGRTQAEVIARVGEKLASWLLRHSRLGDSILVLAGKGHNGDDARATVPHLQGRTVTLLEVQDPAQALAALEAALAQQPRWILDGLFGIGLNRPLNEAWRHFIERINVASRRVVSVDVPSGLDADSGEVRGAAVSAAVTLTLGAPKRGLLHPAAAVHTGRLEVIPDIGLIPCPIGEDLQWTLPGDFEAWPPLRPVGAHKGTFGHLAILAGSLGYHGAAVLTARAAQRARPGLITLCTTPQAYAAVAGQLQAVMVRPWLPDSRPPERLTAWLIGPGLAGTDVSRELIETVVQIWQEATEPVVVDASALDWLPAGAVPACRIRVLTPHPGEAARLLRCSPAEVQADRVSALRKLSEQYGHAWVVLKGHQTLIGRSTGPVYVNCSGNPGLAQGGSGDVLAGYLAGFLAQPLLQQDLCQLVRYAVWQHGAVADHLGAVHPSWIVEDLVARLGQVSPFEKNDATHFLHA
ncbi:MAG: NAD(P)H-hydrate dehydratase [Verrucomicrobiota bacterium]|nr:NAD(P)H-hydrate dehydratase [Limisphaera sp.]MDW8381018.1 NAD(P)H-hydrate dehydratase [Verrucomicrobiota bacterium]